MEFPLRSPRGAALAIVATLGIVCGAPVASAHHSFAVHFVADRMITVDGVVTEFRFSNPHGLLMFSVEQPDGTEEVWKAETNSPNVLRRRGWTKDSLAVGDRVTVEGFPARDGSSYMRVSRVVLDDGTELIGQRAASGLAPSPAQGED